MNRSNRTFDASGLTALELTERSFRAPKSKNHSNLEERLAQANQSRKERLNLIRRYVAEMKEDLHGSVETYCVTQRELSGHFTFNNFLIQCAKGALRFFSADNRIAKESGTTRECG